MNISTELIQILMEIGYFAGENGYPVESEVIFEALRQARPNSEYPLIGLAVTMMNLGKYDEAVQTLTNEALGVNPESNLAKSFLGLALKLAGRTEECKGILNEVINQNEDQIAVNMANSILSEI